MYTLNTDAARQADQTGKYINEIGKYVGKFTRAEDITAKTGAKGIAFTFESGGKTANLSIYTQKSNGDTIMGFDVLMAMLTCLSTKKITPTEGEVTRWDKEAKKEYKATAQIFPELMGKDIGLLLETEDYPKSNGDIGTRMVIAGIFQAGTELTASEILDRKTTPEQLGKRVATLKHHPSKDAKPKQAAPAGGFPDDIDDDWPF